MDLELYYTRFGALLGGELYLARSSTQSGAHQAGSSTQSRTLLGRELYPVGTLLSGDSIQSGPYLARNSIRSGVLLSRSATRLGLYPAQDPSDTIPACCHVICHVTVFELFLGNFLLISLAVLGIREAIIRIYAFIFKSWILFIILKHYVVTRLDPSTSPR